MEHNGAVKRGNLYYRFGAKKGVRMSKQALGPSENEGRRIEDVDGIYEVIGGRRYWVECNAEKAQMLRLDALAEERQRRSRGSAGEG